jgi:glycosyltransferase involved in cell wall biosynthesis
MKPAVKAETRTAFRIIAFFRCTAEISPTETKLSEDVGIGWARVRKARPNFVDHYQPHVPRELGYYDTSDFVVREAQAHLARVHGVSAFCYLCTWDPGKQTLAPEAETLVSPNMPDFPFCVCWENGSIDPVAEGARADGSMPPIYSNENSVALIHSLIPIMRDRRYVRIDGRPLLIVAQPHVLANAEWVMRAWRDECVRAGLEDPYLVCYGTAWGGYPVGFDAAVEFPPAGFYPESHLSRVELTNPKFRGEVRSYRSSLAQSLAAHRPRHKLFQTVMPAWDETARNQNASMVFVGSTPELFAQWTERALQRTWMRFSGEERIVFVRSWNEWNLGCHLEPDERYGLQYLEALRDAVNGTTAQAPERPSLAAVSNWASAPAGASAARIVRSSYDPAGSGPRVSVVMPAYNHERFVIQALDSVFAQSHDNLEVIVVNDGSRDTTGALVDDYAAHCIERRLTVVHQQNAGAHEALNHGLSLASGEVIALINSDDLYAPVRIERLLAEMTRRQAAFAFSDTCFVDEEGTEFGDDDAYVSGLREAITAGTEAPDPLYGFVVTNIAISTGNFVFRRDLLEKTGGFCGMRVCHDWDFVMAASYHTPLAFVREPLYLYRVHRGNTFSSQKLLGRLEIEQLQSRFFADIARHPLVSDADRARQFYAHAHASGLGGFLPKAIPGASPVWARLKHGED